MHRRKRPDRRVESRDRVTQADSHFQWRTIWETGDEPQTAHGLAGASVPRSIAIRAALSVSRDAHDDELGVLFAESSRVKVPRLQPTGAEILDQDVCRGCEAASELLALRYAEIDDDRLLIARLHHGPKRVLAGDHAPGPQRIAAGWLDLDDARTHVGKQAGGEGTRDQGAHLEDAQT